MTTAERRRDRCAIPQHEPEVVQAKANRHWHGDNEKVATTSIKRLQVRGVEVTSRYNKAHEFELMQDMILALPEHLARCVRSIFCNSKATLTYDITLRTWDAQRAKEIADVIEGVAQRQDGWHNGITVSAGGSLAGDQCVWRNPG